MLFCSQLRALLFTFALMPLIACASNTDDTAHAAPNILFIAVDDLRPTIGSYGDPSAITPHLDRFAERSLQFNRAYCQVAVCNPSRASLMTGQMPDKLGVWTLPIHFREAKPDAVTIPQWFRKHGYTAVSHGKIYHNPTPDPQSWSEPIRRLPPLPSPYPKGTRALVRETMDGLPARDWRKKNLRPPSTASPDFDDNKLLDGARTDMAIEDLKRLAAEDKPFFLAMGYIRPHLAWVAPKKYWDMHDPDTLPVAEDQSVIPNTPPYAPHNNSELSHYVDLVDMPRPWDEQELPSEKKRQLVHGYYACVSYIDAQIGRLLDALEETGEADNTIIVLWSDHGWKLGENRGWGKMTNYELDARVPMYLSAPGMATAGKQTEQLVELLDLFPTLCDLAKIDTPDFVDGKSLMPLTLDTETQIRDKAVSQYYRQLEKRQYMGYSMRTDRYRFIEWRDFRTGEVTARELYDHHAEEVARTNLAESASPDLIEQLTQQLLQTHPRRELVMKPAIHSAPTGQRFEQGVTFVNQMEVDVRLYLISPLGRRPRPGRRVAPEQSVTMPTRVGNVYVIESADGTLHRIHRIEEPGMTITISPTTDVAM